ncbi:M23 family metallopeptidase [Effusibacillus consociatus]|uniref:M23 family metallopeptidase n=1 Tax=Effusibacillus consociatus TaxID=1117041 RepID=A0ABV9Q5L6_9BACL
MLRRRMGLLCGILAILAAGRAHAGNASPARESVHILLTQERQLQEQVKVVHRQILDVNEKLKQIDERISEQSGQASTYSLQNQQTVKAMTEKYSIVYLPLAMASQIPVWSWNWEEREQKKSQLALREQAIKEKEQLQTTEKQLREKLRTVSDSIMKATGKVQKEGSIDNLDLEKLASLLAWPVPVSKEVTSDYGWRNLNGNVEFHTGIDVAADLGDPIHASADGVVLFAGSAQGFGNWIVIRHEQGLMTIYGHMFRNGIQVKPGQTVRKGDLIGKVGSAGQSYGPHLHFAVATGMKSGSMVTVNPWSFLEQ